MKHQRGSWKAPENPDCFKHRCETCEETTAFLIQTWMDMGLVVVRCLGCRQEWVMNKKEFEDSII